MSADPRVLKARELEREAHREWSAADMQVRLLEGRAVRAEAALAQYMGDWPGADPDRLVFADVAQRLEEDEGRVISGEKIIMADSPPSEAEVEAAHKALRDAERVWSKAKDALAEAVRQALEEPYEVPDGARWLCGKDRMVLAGEVYYRGEAIPGEVVASLPVRKRKQLVELEWLVENVAVSA